MQTVVHESTLMTILRPIVRFLYRILFWPRVVGRENLAQINPNQAAVLAGNHVHELDAVPMEVFSPRNAHFLAKVELAQWKRSGWLMRHLGLIFVDRDQKNSALESAIKTASYGQIVALFPEGTCSKKFKKSNELLPFKFGAIEISQATSAPIIPVAVAGSYKLFSRPCIIFGQPMLVGRREKLDVANERLRYEIAKLMKQIGVKNVRIVRGKPAKNPAKSPPILDK